MATTFGTPAYGDRGAVATPHYLASLAGRDVLRDGGSAVDAAIAANLVLAVVWPHMCGPGGDLLAQVWSPADGRVVALNASGRAGVGMSVAAYRELDQGQQTMPARGPLSVSVPGAVDGWFALHERWGRLSMERLVRDAVFFARVGFRITRFVGDAVRANQALIGGLGWPTEAGARLVQADLAASLEAIARHGPDVLYRGELGERLVSFLRAQGGLLLGEDLAAHRSEWVAPIAMEYRECEVYELPPNSQGIALLQMLGMLAEVDVSALPPAGRVHELVERKKLAFADRDAYVADPACAFVPVDGLLAGDYLASRSLEVGALAARGGAAGRPSVGDGDTIYLCAADSDGMVVSLIQSLYSAFGSGVHVAGTGITLHNRASGFVLDADHPNALAPGKRPLHTLMPGLVVRHGEPWLAFGTRGADGQPQTGLQILTQLLDDGVEVQTAQEAPRWVHAAPGDRFSRTALVLESRFGSSVAAALAERGHQVIETEPLDAVMGTVQLLQVDQQRGCYIAATDPRGDGVSLAF